MNVTCNDRERIFEDGTAAEWEALEAHAVVCRRCAEELLAWKSLSVAARELQDYSPSPELWGRIERGLSEEQRRKAHRSEGKRRFSFLPNIPLGWQTALAGAFVLMLTASVTWILRHPIRQQDKQDPLLRSAALKEVESAESAYEKAIDRLAREAKPQLDTPSTPLLAAYQEKLQVLDSAIADLRAQAGLNPSNAQLRYQLLAMYQEKQRTLEEVLEAPKQ